MSSDRRRYARLPKSTSSGAALNRCSGALCSQERLAKLQSVLVEELLAPRPKSFAQLVDRISGRLGADCYRQAHQ